MSSRNDRASSVPHGHKVRRLVLVRSWHAAVLSMNHCARDLFVCYFLKVNPNTKSVMAVFAAPDPRVAFGDTAEGDLLSVAAHGTMVIRQDHSLRFLRYWIHADRSASTGRSVCEKQENLGRGLPKAKQGLRRARLPLSSIQSLCNLDFSVSTATFDVLSGFTHKLHTVFMKPHGEELNSTRKPAT